MWRSIVEQAGGPPELAGSVAWAMAHPHGWLALAMLHVESKYGTAFKRNKAAHKNPLNLRPPGGDGYMAYPAWVDGVDAWRERITSPDYKGGIYAQTVSLEDLIHVYAPGSDDNDEAGYVATIKTLFRNWGVTPKENPLATQPIIHNLATDFALYGLAKWQADIILSKHIPNRLGYQPQGIVWHIQDGRTRGSLTHWVGVQASSTVMINKDGSILNVIPRRHGPWTNGDVSQPSARGRHLQALGGGDPNRVSITVEMDGEPGDPLTPAQRNAAIWFALDVMREFPHIDMGDMYKHADLNSVSRPNCPDGYYTGLMADIQAAITPPKPVKPKPTINWNRGDVGLSTINDTPVLRLVGQAVLVNDTTSRYGASTKSKAFKRYKKGQKVVVVGTFDSRWAVIDAGDGAFPRVSMTRLDPTFPLPKHVDGILDPIPPEEE